MERTSVESGPNGGAKEPKCGQHLSLGFQVATKGFLTNKGCRHNEER